MDHWLRPKPAKMAPLIKSPASTANRGTVHEGQIKSIIQDMERGIPFRDAMLGSGSESLGEMYGGKFTHSKSQPTEKVHAVPITPALRKSVLQTGQPIAKNSEPTWADGIKALARPQVA